MSFSMPSDVRFVRQNTDFVLGNLYFSRLPISMDLVRVLPITPGDTPPANRYHTHSKKNELTEYDLQLHGDKPP